MIDNWRGNEKRKCPKLSWKLTLTLVASSHSRWQVSERENVSATLANKNTISGNWKIGKQQIVINNYLRQLERGWKLTIWLCSAFTSAYAEAKSAIRGSWSAQEWYFIKFTPLCDILSNLLLCVIFLWIYSSVLYFIKFSPVRDIFIRFNSLLVQRDSIRLECKPGNSATPSNKSENHIKHDLIIWFNVTWIMSHVTCEFCNPFQKKWT